jgi:hypothetical protein
MASVSDGTHNTPSQYLFDLIKTTFGISKAIFDLFNNVQLNKV